MSDPVSAATPDDVARRIFRAHDAYEVIPYDRLPARDQATIAEFARDPEFFGILHPRNNAAGTIKAISRNVALLIYALQSPGVIPRLAVAAGDASILDAAWRLTLDGVLEIQQGDTFVSGADALRSVSDNKPNGAIARISFEALKLVAQIGSDDAAEMSERLYHFNRRPMTARWGARIRTPSEVVQFAGAGVGSATATTLDRYWKHKPPERHDPWLTWWPRTAEYGTPPGASSDVTYKLYVSPHTEDLPDVFPDIVKLLAESGAPPFKIGASATGILRPDKIVVYFAHRDAAEEVGAALLTRFRDARAHPVPFTRELGAEGFVSLGIDPPLGRAMLMQVGVSWRQWVCRRLASYVCVSLRAGRSDADRFAIDRIALDGIEPATWEPSATAVRGFATGAPA